MKRILFSDTHFGWKQNSITWLEHQMSFIDNQLIPYIKGLKGEDIRLIHLGDVFDSRSSINPMVAKRVREKFTELRSLVNEFYIVAGNHDFYSPNSAEFDSLTMVLRECDIHLVIDEVVVKDNDMFIPWYKYKEDIGDLLANHPEVDNIYTHADIFGEDFKQLPERISLFSGHIHCPIIKEKRYNLGSCYPLTFIDSNSERYFYVYDDELNAIANKYSIRFWRLYNEEIFQDPNDNNDYYELYIDQNNMQDVKYQERISELTKGLKNLWVIPQIIHRAESDDDIEFSSYNIEEMCKSYIPEHLMDKFELIEMHIKNE